MFKYFLTKNMLKWMPIKEQNMYERKLTDVMKSLKVKDYNFNWDRTSCFIEFHYRENFYRLEHSVEKADKKGIFLRNGLDCLMELIQSLEDLSGIIDRGINDFETWISGMKQASSETKMFGFQEEFEIRYKKLLGRQNGTEYNTGELEGDSFPFGTEPSLREFEEHHLDERSLSAKARF